MMKKSSNRSHWPKHSKSSYRSGLEDRNAKLLGSWGIPVVYEKHKLDYQLKVATCPSCAKVIYSDHTYTPDFLLPNGIFVETKGRFMPKDRKKHIAVRAGHPTIDIRFVFTNPNSKLRKGSKTTYAQWCDKKGFIYSHAYIPKDWTN